MKILIKNHFPLIIFLGFYLVFSFFTYKHFGVTTDEPLEYQSANALLDFYGSELSFKGDIRGLLKMPEDELRHVPLLSHYYRGHLLLHALLFSSDNYHELHLLNMLLGLPLFIAVYLFFYFLFKNKYLSIIPVLFLFFDPRILGHIPANPKDFPFAMWYLLSILGIYWYVKSGLISKANFYLNIIMGLVFGLALAIRPLGVTLIPVYIIFLFYMNYFHSKLDLKLVFQNIITQFLSAFILIVLTWPFIGSSPIQNFYFYLFESSKFAGWNGSVLFDGKFYNFDEIPNYYLYTWLLITTPLLHLCLFIIGFIFTKKFYKDSFIFILSITVLLNLTIYSLLNPLIYNGYRHYLFLIAILTLLATYIFIKLLLEIKKNKYSIYIISILIVLSLNLIKDFIFLHPYQNIYFSEISGGLKNAGQKFETDYWFQSRLDATEWILNSQYKESPVYVCNMPYIIEYYSNNKLKVSKDIDDSVISICDPKRELQKEITGDLIHSVDRDGINLTNIRLLEK